MHNFICIFVQVIRSKNEKKEKEKRIEINANLLFLQLFMYYYAIKTKFYVNSEGVQTKVT